jgi:hypothetical protein
MSKVGTTMAFCVCLKCGALVFRDFCMRHYMEHDAELWAECFDDMVFHLVLDRWEKVDT